MGRLVGFWKRMWHAYEHGSFDGVGNGILEIIEHQVVSIILYGSVAKGTNTEESDVDVALLMKGN